MRSLRDKLQQANQRLGSDYPEPGLPWRCRCQQHHLTVRRHNRVLRGETEYRCVRCGERLQPGDYQPAAD